MSTTSISLKRHNSLPSSQNRTEPSSLKPDWKNLPTELNHIVFQNLDVGSLLNLAMTSRFYREQVDFWIKIKAAKLPEGFLLFLKDGRLHSAKNRPPGSSVAQTPFFKMDTTGRFCYKNDSIEELATLVKAATFACKITGVFLDNIELTQAHLALLQSTSPNPFRYVEKCETTLSILSERVLAQLLTLMQRVKSLSCTYSYEQDLLDFSCLKNVENLSLAPTNLDPPRQERLFSQLDANKKTLRSLSFEVPLLGGRIYSKLNRFINLEKLSLRCTTESLQNLSRIHLGHLREFSFQNPALLFETADELQLQSELKKFLNQHKTLTTLCLNDLPLKDDITLHFPETLIHLEIKNSLIGKEGLKTIKNRCPNLRSLLASHITCSAGDLVEVFENTEIEIVAYGLVQDKPVIHYPTTIQVQDPFDSD